MFEMTLNKPLKKKPFVRMEGKCNKLKVLGSYKWVVVAVSADLCNASV